MELMDVISARKSIRKFKDTKISSDDLKEIVEAATRAPSAHNKQPWRFIAVTNRDINDKCSRAVAAKIDRIVEEYNITESVKGWKYYSTFFNGAPAVIYVLYKKVTGFLEKASQKELSQKEVERMRVHPEIQSIGGAIQNLLLAAAEKGYGTCWMTAPNIAAPEIEKILGVEEPWQLAAIIPVGVPAENPAPRPRKPLAEVFEVRE